MDKIPGLGYSNARQAGNVDPQWAEDTHGDGVDVSAELLGDDGPDIGEHLLGVGSADDHGAAGGDAGDRAHLQTDIKTDISEREGWTSSRVHRCSKHFGAHRK